MIHTDDNMNKRRSFTAYTLQFNGFDTTVDSMYVKTGVNVSLVIVKFEVHKYPNTLKRLSFFVKKLW